MDQATLKILETVLLNLFSSGVWELIRDPLFGRGLQPDPSSRFADAIDEAIALLEPLLRHVDEAAVASVAEFLESAEVRSIVAQLYRTRFIEPARPLAELRQAFSTVWGVQHAPVVRALPAYDLFDGLVTGCDLLLERAVKEGDLSAHESLSAARHHDTSARLAAIEEQVRLLRKATDTDLIAIEGFETTLRGRLAEAYSVITPPSVKGVREVGMDAVYVEPLFGAPELKQALSLAEISAQAHRLVVLGDPGAGKSTLARNLCLEVARDRVRLAGSARGLAMFIELREYARNHDHHAAGFVAYLAELLQGHFALEPPPNAISYLLKTGRMSVVFDGLDELPVGTGRRTVRDAIQHFGASYPLAHVVATSRLVGYEHASLDEAIFQSVRLFPFDEERTARYATKWFSINNVDDPARGQSLAEAFVAESRVAPDLRANPLMLGLMCVLYSGQGWIPRNRPDLYGQCATYLFETWDKQRGVEILRPFDDLLRPALRKLALWVYTSPGVQRGITTSEAVSFTTDFLVSQRYTDRLRAEHAAATFIEFCRGRAWIFTDVGTDETGGDLFAFTHRTFLEFFAAEQVLNDNETTADLIDLIAPKILSGSWEVVALLAVHVKERRKLNSADEIIEQLLTRTKNDQGVRRRRVLMFASQVLQGLALKPQTVSSVADAVLGEITSADLEPKSRRLSLSHSLETFRALLLCDPPNRDQLAQRMVMNAGVLIGSESDRERRLGAEYASLRNDGLHWPRRDGLKWPHLASVVCVVDIA